MSVLALPLTALALPVNLPTGTDSLIPATLLLTWVLWGVWLVSMWLRNHWQFVHSPLNRPALVFCVICCISLVWGVVWRDPVLVRYPKFIFVQVASLLTFLASVGASFLIGNFFRTEARLKYLVGAFLVCGSLMALTQLLGVQQVILNDRGLWGTWTIIVAYGLLIAQPSMRWRWRIALICVIIILLYLALVVNSSWFSGWMPMLCAMVVATWFRSKRMFFALFVVAAICIFLSQSFFAEIIEDDYAGGTNERPLMWEQNWQLIRDHWLFGTGPAGYALYYVTYFKDFARSTHNNYMDILSQFGVAGMLAWLWLIIVSVLEGRRLFRRAPPGFLKTMLLIATSGWIAAQVAMMLGDWVLPFAYNQTITGYRYTVYSWLFLGVLISIRSILDGQAPAPAGTPGKPPALR
jgi:hypothetical protein